MPRSRALLLVAVLLALVPNQLQADDARSEDPLSDGRVCERIRTTSADTPQQRLVDSLREAHAHAEHIASGAAEEGEEGERGAAACIHGELDEDGVCLCAADWFGDACDVHILTEAFYLPRRAPWLPSRVAAAQRAHFLGGSARLAGDLDRLQHAENRGTGAEEARPGEQGAGTGDATGAEACPVLAVAMDGRGFGSWVHHITGALGTALSANRTLALRHAYDYFFHDGCPASAAGDEDARCYLQPLVTLSAAARAGLAPPRPSPPPPPHPGSALRLVAARSALPPPLAAPAPPPGSLPALSAGSDASRCHRRSQRSRFRRARRGGWSPSGTRTRHPRG
jgi:hypothetical protein